MRVPAGLEKVVDELVVEVAGLDKAAAELGDGVDPVGGPRRTALVHSGFRGASDVADALGVQPGGQSAAEEVVDALLA